MAADNQDPQIKDQKVLQLVWMAIVGGVVLLSIVMVFLLQSGSGGTTEDGSLFIFLNAAIGIGAILAGFMVQRKLDESLESVSTYEEAIMLIKSRSILSIALVEASALFAVISMFITGDVMNLAFVVPFFAFAWLFFPSMGRFAYWKAIWESNA